MHFRPEDIDWWYVNLASRPDRDAHARAEFARAGITNVRRFEAFLPSDWPGDRSKVERMRLRTPGAIGCMMSQMHLMRTAVGTDRVIGICEDDVCFCADLQARLEYLGTRLPDDWSVCWLGATFHVRPAQWHRATLGRDAERTADSRIFRTFGIWSTYAYLVNGKKAAQVYDLLDQNMYRADGIDHCMMLYVEPILKNTYCFVPGCAWQYDNRSNIGNGVTVFSHFQKLGPYAWQQRMNDFDPDRYDWGEAGVRT